MAVDNIDFATESNSRRNKFGRRVVQSTVKSSQYGLVFGFCTGCSQTDGIRDGRASDSVNENINKEQGIAAPPP